MRLYRDLGYHQQFYSSHATEGIDVENGEDLSLYYAHEKFKLVNQKSLREAMAEKYKFLSNYVDYLGEREESLRPKYKLAAKVPYFITFYVKCIDFIMAKSTYPEGVKSDYHQTRFDIRVYTSPIPFTFPELGMIYYASYNPIFIIICYI